MWYGPCNSKATLTNGYWFNVEADENGNCNPAISNTIEETGFVTKGSSDSGFWPVKGFDKTIRVYARTEGRSIKPMIQRYVAQADGNGCLSKPGEYPLASTVFGQTTKTNRVPYSPCFAFDNDGISHTSEFKTAAGNYGFIG